MSSFGSLDEVRKYIFEGKEEEEIFSSIDDRDKADEETARQELLSTHLERYSEIIRHMADIKLIILKRFTDKVVKDIQKDKKIELISYRQNKNMFFLYDKVFDRRDVRGWYAVKDRFEYYFIIDSEISLEKSIKLSQEIWHPDIDEKGNQFSVFPTLHFILLFDEAYVTENTKKLIHDYSNKERTFEYLMSFIPRKRFDEYSNLIKYCCDLKKEYLSFVEMSVNKKYASKLDKLIIDSVVDEIKRRRYNLVVHDDLRVDRFYNAVQSNIKSIFKKDNDYTKTLKAAEWLYITHKDVWTGEKSPLLLGYYKSLEKHLRKAVSDLALGKTVRKRQGNSYVEIKIDAKYLENVTLGTLAHDLFIYKYRDGLCSLFRNEDIYDIISNLLRDFTIENRNEYVHNRIIESTKELNEVRDEIYDMYFCILAFDILE